MHLHHQSKLRIIYNNSDFVLDDFAVANHNSNKFDSALIKVKLKSFASSTRQRVSLKEFRSISSALIGVFLIISSMTCSE